MAGCDIDAVMAGAKEAQDAFTDPCLEKNDCYKYAAVRNILYNKGYSVEIMASYEPSYGQMNEWFKQLYGESEGKDHKALYPSSVIFSTDLHSLGQYIQDGRRQLLSLIHILARKTKTPAGPKPSMYSRMSSLASGLPSIPSTGEKAQRASPQRASTTSTAAILKWREFTLFLVVSFIPILL